MEPTTDILGDTEAGYASAFAVDVRDQMLFDHREGQWFLCADGRWAPDQDGQAVRTIQQWLDARTLDKIDRATKLGDLESARRVARRDLSTPVVKRVLELSRFQAPLAKSGDHWHSDASELATSDGRVIDLRTGGMRPADPLDFVRRTTRVPCDPAQRCDLWRAFIREVLNEDAALMTFMQRLLGYCLTGDISEQVFAMLIGSGSNGKSTCIEVVGSILGAYAGVLPFTELVRQRDTRGASPEIAKLVGLRLVRVVEFPANATLDVARLKSVTGGDTLSVRGLFKEPFDFTPGFKLLLCANVLPRVQDTSHAFWRRAVPVPFLRRFDATTRDPHLKARLLDEAPGILGWLVEGCLDWQQHGLPIPAACVAAAADWREQDDPIGPWITAEVVEDADGRLPARDAYAAYLRWCERERLADRERATHTAFGKYLASRFPRFDAKQGRVYAIRLVEGGGLHPPFGKYSSRPAHEEGFHKGSKPSTPSTPDLSPDDEGFDGLPFLDADGNPARQPS